MPSTPEPAIGAPPAAARWRRAAVSCSAAAITLVILFALLHGRQRDFRVPLTFSQDALEYLMQAKGTIDHGWWWTNSSLSAPGSFDQVAYPSNTNVDQAVVWLMRVFTHDAGMSLNVVWMLLVAVSAAIATACLSRLGLSLPLAFAGGVLFALSPYALYRNVQHFALVTFLVPVPCTAALLIASRRLTSAHARAAGLLLAGCVLVGLDYTYYAFFACFLLLVASAIGWLNGGDRRALAVGLTFVAAISLATAVNLAPSFRTWAVHGQPIIIPDKTPAEAETYGLKIRQLVSPLVDETLPPFRAWTTREAAARFPLETENATSRLGVCATVGFLALLAGLLAPRGVARLADAELFASSGRLTLAAVLLGTIGGFGSLFSLLVSPEIRSYNRLCPFIAFYALFGLGLILERLATGRASSPRGLLLRRLAVASAVLAVGLYDQGHAAAPLNTRYPSARDELAGVRWFVGNLEAALPPRAMVFQLPVTTYLNDAGLDRMLPYDHIKPYLVSRTLHWSYPALDDATARWQRAVGRLRPGDLVAAVANAGFAAIVIDRYGYDDNGDGILAALGAPSHPKAVLAESGRYVGLDVRLLPRSEGDGGGLPRFDGRFEPATLDVPACSGPALAAIDQIGATRAPFSLAPVALDARGRVTIRGWAIDAGGHDTAGDVDLVVDGRPFAAFYGIDRPDIAARFGARALRNTGVLARVPETTIGPGAHQVSLRVLSADRRCFADSAAIAVVGR